MSAAEGLTSSKKVKLYVAALEGNWEAVTEKIGNDIIIKGSITEQGETALHVAALARHQNFVKKLVNKLNPEDMEITNNKGNNSLCYAAISGHVEIAKLMVEAGNKELPNPKTGMKPLMVAASSEHSEMVRYLYTKTNVQDWTADEQADLFTTCVRIGLTNLALTMLHRNPKLATAQNKYGETALLVLACTPSIFPDGSQPRLLKRFLSSFFKVSQGRNSNQSKALQLVEKLCNHGLKFDLEEPMTSNTEVAKLMYDAAEVGNVDFLVKLIHFNPDLLWIRDEQRGSIFHVAVEKRHQNIFNLLFELGAIQDFIAKRIIGDENNMLHLAAKLAPQEKLQTLRGAALQMHQELLWFMAVEKIVPTPYRDLKNSEGDTPRALFVKTHKNLKEEGEKWMKDIAKSSMFVATLLVIVMFFTTLGVSKDSLSMDFSTSIAISIFSSTTSMLIFWSILTTRYAEKDFILCIPKLLIGITTLFISMVALVVTFLVTILQYYHHGRIFIYVVLGCVPVIYLAIIYPLLVDLIQSICNSRFMFRSCKRLFY